MGLSVGYLLLTHSVPGQIARLVQRINELFDDPIIVCHHDFGQCPLPQGLLPGNVEFVQPSLKTSWGMWSIAEATSRALEQLFDRPNPPDWFILLSGSDYPICSADRVLSDLSDTDCDAFVQHDLVDPTTASTPWEIHCARRYFARRLWVPIRDRHLPRSWKSVVLRPPGAWGASTPFSSTFRCYYGSHFLTANGRSAERILQFRKNDQTFSRHCHRCPYPEEIYFSTILANTPELRLNNDNLRYIDWRQGGPHPKQLTKQDLPEVLASGKHFSRKFSTDSEVLDMIDDFVDTGRSPITGPSHS